MLNAIHEKLLAADIVLDFGCSDGAFANHIIELGARKVLGIDICTTSIEIAKSRNITNGEFMVCDIEKQSDSIGMFDLILSHDTFILFPPVQKQSILEILYKKLIVGGSIIINDFNRQIIFQNIAMNLKSGNPHANWHLSMLTEYLSDLSPEGNDCFGGIYNFVHESFYLSLDLPLAEIKYLHGKGLFHPKRAVSQEFEKHLWISDFFDARDLIIITKKR